eukprot:TRINITY_DN1790_c0_g3_i4.p1 TRINITY_DN1790_c0_g3~~TRINITY_DN1790_c0_g3_i4.p1  ORF type:complete len:662 (+),score=107.70 TRINITY_DN1790_c0_g3_i4:470-2455(+)
MSSSSTQWPQKEVLRKELEGILKTKPPVSRTCVKSITHIADENFEYFKFVVRDIVKFMSGVPPPYLLSTLYIVHDIISSTKKKDWYRYRFNEKLPEVFPRVVDKCPTKDKEKMVKLLENWKREGAISNTILELALNKLMGSSVSSSSSSTPPNTAIVVHTQKQLPRAKEGSTSQTVHIYLDSLPSEILQHIFSFFPPFPDLFIVATVCKLFNSVAMDKSLWRNVSFTSINNISSKALYLLFEHNYDHLRKLSLRYCKNVDDRVLEAIPWRCKNLEVLDISSCYKITNLGICSLRYCENLRKLYMNEIFKGGMEGLKAITDGCRLLKKLEIRCCHGMFPFITEIQDPPPNLEVLNVSCYCYSGRIHLSNISEMLIRFNSLKKLLAVGVIFGISLEGENISVGESGELVNVMVGREGVKIHTVDLWWAVMIGNLQLVKDLLMGAGGKMEGDKIVGVPKKFINARGKRGATPIQTSISSGRADISKLLISAGADINLRDMDYNSPLSMTKTAQMVKILVEAGVTPVTKREFAVIDVLAILEKFGKNKFLPPTEEDAECLLMFLQHIPTDKDLFEIKQDAINLFIKFIENRSFMRKFIQGDTPKRRTLVRSTLNHDQFFQVVMPFMSNSLTTEILISLGENGFQDEEPIALDTKNSRNKKKAKYT